MRRPIDEAAELADARAACLQQIGRRPRARWTWPWRRILAAPVFGLVELLGFHGILAHEHNGFHCRCGRFVHVRDLRAFALPPQIDGPCLAARLGRWIYWRRC